MLITIYHNKFQKELEIKEDDSMGYLLEKFLQCCNLLIYNIEYCIVTLNKKKHMKFIRRLKLKKKIIKHVYVHSFLDQMNFHFH